MLLAQELGHAVGVLLLLFGGRFAEDCEFLRKQIRSVLKRADLRPQIRQALEQVRQRQGEQQGDALLVKVGV